MIYKNKRIKFSAYSDPLVFLMDLNKKRYLLSLPEHIEKYKPMLFIYTGNMILKRERKILLADPITFGVSTNSNKIIKFIGPERTLGMKFLYELLEKTITEEEYNYINQFKEYITTLPPSLEIASEHIDINLNNLFKDYTRVWQYKLSSKNILKIHDPKIKNIFNKLKSIYPFGTHFPELEFYFSMYFINPKYYKVIFYYFLHLMKYHLIFKYIKRDDIINHYLSQVDERIEVNIRKLIKRFYTNLNIDDTDFLSYIISSMRAYIISRNKIHTIIKGLLRNAKVKYIRDKVRLIYLDENVYDDSKIKIEDKVAFKKAVENNYEGVYTDLENEIKDKTLSKIYEILEYYRISPIVITEYIIKKRSEGYDILKDKDKIKSEIIKDFGDKGKIIYNAFESIIKTITENGGSILC